MKKLPLGGIDRRTLLKEIAENGLPTARADLARELNAVRPQGVTLPPDHCVLLLGGSNGILRALAVQLVFGEKVAVHCLHYDSEKLQIGPKHAQAIREEADRRGLHAVFENADATHADVIAATVETLKARFSVVHLVNGIAAGAPKRYAEHGPTQVLDIDVGFDPVRQIADFTQIRELGLVDVDVATPQDVDKTNRLMGESTRQWADAGVLTPGQSVVAFADYDFSPDDPVYGMGPLAGAKMRQRESMRDIAARFRVATVRLCYPAMNTTALAAIPGALLAYVLTAATLGDKLRSLPQLAAASMAMFVGPPELRLDSDYQRVLPDLRAAQKDLTLERVREAARALHHG